MDVFAVRHPGNCADVHANAIRNVLENHGLQIDVVSTEEVCTLMLNDGLHGLGQRFLALNDGIHKPLGRIHLLLDKSQRFLGRFVLLSALGIGVHHVAVRSTHPQFGRIPSVQLQHDVLSVDRQKEIWNDVMHNT